MNRMRKVILLIILTLGLLITGCSAESSQQPVVGKVAPDFKLQSLNAQSISLSSLRGKPVLINFWAIWCAPCRDEMPYIQQVYDEWHTKKLVVLAINIGGIPSQVEEFMQIQGLSLPVLLDQGGSVAQKYNVFSIPTTFFIDKNGIIYDKIIGAFQNRAQIEQRLSKIIP